MAGPPCPVYQGSFTDRFPHIAAPVTPAIVKKFRNTTNPAPGAKRIFYGRADDPDIAAHLTHGITSGSSVAAVSLINPVPKTNFQQQVQDTKEAIYFSNREAPLGRSHDQSSMLPEGLDISSTTFGTKTIQDTSAGELINPPKTSEEVDKEAREGHDLYVVSHNDYYPGEAINRKYDSPNFSKSHVYGIETPHFEDGRNVSKSLNWLYDWQVKRAAKIVSKRIDDFKEKFQPQIGKALDPNVRIDSIAETMNVPADHTFGMLLRSDECEKKIDVHLQSDTKTDDEPLLKQEDLVLKEMGSSEMTPKTLTRPTDRIFADYQTTSSQYNAVVGGLPTNCYPVCGVPTIRSDIPTPRIRRISDRTNYGDEANAYALLFPSVFGQKGVYEGDFFKSRPKAEV
ncbi:UNVERIFIED_CONTAM: hypothetical protein H355_015127 [Colinus virginianus]|nr:hypothetical protein H355_015127 [Colinus virginianus]